MRTLEEIDPLKGTETVLPELQCAKDIQLEEIDPLKGTETCRQFAIHDVHSFIRRDRSPKGDGNNFVCNNQLVYGYQLEMIDPQKGGAETKLCAMLQLS